MLASKNGCWSGLMYTINITLFFLVINRMLDINSKLTLFTHSISTSNKHLLRK